MSLWTLEFTPQAKRDGKKLKGSYSQRINIQHRLVYQVIEEKRLIKILRMWNHYD